MKKLFANGLKWLEIPNNMKVIDLTEDLYSEMNVYPGDPKVKIRQLHTIEKQGWRLKLLQMGSHTGTHVDAFSHMDNHGMNLDKMPLTRFFGKAIIVKKGQKYPQRIGLAFVQEDLTLEDYGNINESNPPFILVSSDCSFPVLLERKLLQSGIVTVTGLINMRKISQGKPFMFYGFPLKIRDGDGSPIRAVAIIE